MIDNILLSIVAAVAVVTVGWVLLVLIVGAFLPLPLKFYLYRYIGVPFRLVYRSIIWIAWMLGEAVLVLGEKLLLPVLIVIGRRLGAAWTTVLADYIDRRAAERAEADHFRRWETERPGDEPRGPHER